MNSMIRKTAPVLLALALLLSGRTSAGAQAEVEADPLAYALNGFSLHLGKVFGSMRASVGTFGIDIPRWFHGNEGWSSSMRGMGVKWDYLGTGTDGFFVGADAGVMRFDYRVESDGRRAKRGAVSTGVRAGYRLPLGQRGLYLSPWVGVGHSFHGEDVVVGADRFERDRITVFPTVHVGWRF